MMLTRNGTVGRVTVQVELASNLDVLMVELNLLSADKVRRVTISGVIDTGATRLMLPKSVVDQLGLTPSGKTTVKYADERRVERPVVFGVWVTIQGRKGLFSAIVEPDRTDALIGAIILEELDFLVDCPHNALVPRDPTTIISEAE